MAEGDGTGRLYERQNHPLNPQTALLHSNQRLTRYDIGNQARFLLTEFIHDRMQREGLLNAPEAESLIEPGTPTGPPVAGAREVAEALRRIGDELDGDEGLQRLLRDLPPDASSSMFQKVAFVIFSDGIFNWGRVVALFYFAFKMAIKAMALSGGRMIELIRGIIEWVINFIIDNVATWILERGGWEAICEYFGTPNSQLVAIFTLGFICSAMLYAWKR